MEDEVEGQGQETGTAGNGLYDEYLSKFSDEYRPVAEEVFKEWDANVTKKFQEYEPYKQFTDYDPDVIFAGINLLSKVAENPREVYEAMASAYGFGQDQEETPAQPQQESAVDQPDYAYQIEELRQMLAEQQQAQQENAAMEEFQGLLSGLKQQYGEYDDEYVLAKIASGAEPEAAVQAYFNFVEQVTGKPREENTPYPVLGGSGGVPANELDFVKMGSKETKDIIAQMLARANQD